MLKICSKCGHIHDKKYVCTKRIMYNRKRTENDKFRSTKSWTEKSIEIRERDKYLCQACIRELEGTIQKYTYDGLEVHHIIPIKEDWDKRLDNYNLITLCKIHHEMAEDGTILREKLKELSEEQEKNSPRG